MGIEKFHQWMTRNFPGCFSNVNQPASFAHVFLDLNGMVHNLCRVCPSETDPRFVWKLFARLNKVLEQTPPTKALYLCLDGPAPLAKLCTQRTRRLKNQHKMAAHAAAALAPALAAPIGVSPLARAPAPNSGVEENIEDELDDDDDETTTPAAPTPVPAATSTVTIPQAPKKRRRPDGINSAHITAGTPFMTRISDVLHYYAAQYLQARKRQHLRVVVSGSSVVGEGECKAIDLLLTCVQQHPSDTVALIGGDSDLYLLALAAGRSNVFVVRPAENKHERTSHFSIDKFLGYLQTQSSVQTPVPSREAFNMRLDFICLALFQGNDYVPKLRGFSMNNAWGTYKRLLRSSGCALSLFDLSDPNVPTFNWGTMAQVLTPLANRWVQLRQLAMLRLESIRANHPQSLDVDEDEDDDGEDALIEDESESTPASTSSPFAAPSHSPSSQLEQYIASMQRDTPFSRSFLSCVLWNMHTYINGVCPSYHMCYVHPSSPSVVDLLNFCRTQSSAQPANAQPYPTFLQPPASAPTPLAPALATPAPSVPVAPVAPLFVPPRLRLHGESGPDEFPLGDHPASSPLLPDEFAACLLPRSLHAECGLVDVGSVTVEVPHGQRHVKQLLAALPPLVSAVRAVPFDRRNPAQQRAAIFESALVLESSRDPATKHIGPPLATCFPQMVAQPILCSPGLWLLAPLAHGFPRSLRPKWGSPRFPNLSPVNNSHNRDCIRRKCHSRATVSHQTCHDQLHHTQRLSLQGFLRTRLCPNPLFRVSPNRAMTTCFPMEPPNRVSRLTSNPSTSVNAATDKPRRLACKSPV
ncbi:putative 5'-3' exoribonuclease 1 [Paratrimastix pyriformis]|uniref:5'-3' exoribonuclease 1 n=1 Tax=Paratrimastix pyriformis TaxID=342808 RepID=A0ABQ8UK96_9EUKA|nr:putative 5'-3' exoribonuclease 1 [Paratrimastix pyriformis]